MKLVGTLLLALFREYVDDMYMLWLSDRATFLTMVLFMLISAAGITALMFKLFQ